MRKIVKFSKSQPLDKNGVMRYNSEKCTSSVRGIIFDDKYYQNGSNLLSFCTIETKMEFVLSNENVSGRE